MKRPARRDCEWSPETGKGAEVAPMWPGDSPRELLGRIEVSASYFSDRIGLGSRVETSRKSANRGRVVTVQFNPREGQCYPAPGL